MDEDFVRSLSNSLWQVCLHRSTGLPCGSGSKESAYNAGDWIISLGWEDPLQKEMATHSSILP